MRSKPAPRWRIACARRTKCWSRGSRRSRGARSSNWCGRSPGSRQDVATVRRPRPRSRHYRRRVGLAVADRGQSGDRHAVHGERLAVGPQPVARRRTAVEAHASCSRHAAPGGIGMRRQPDGGGLAPDAEQQLLASTQAAARLQRCLAYSVPCRRFRRDQPSPASDRPTSSAEAGSGASFCSAVTRTLSSAAP